MEAVASIRADADCVDLSDVVRLVLKRHFFLQSALFSQNTPKDKQVRTQSRRAASKEALKQMHLLLGDEKHYEISSDDDDVSGGYCVEVAAIFERGEWRVRVTSRGVIAIFFRL